MIDGHKWDRDGKRKRKKRSVANQKHIIKLLTATTVQIMTTKIIKATETNVRSIAIHINSHCQTHLDCAKPNISHQQRVLARTFGERATVSWWCASYFECMRANKFDLFRDIAVKNLRTSSRSNVVAVNKLNLSFAAIHYSSI